MEKIVETMDRRIRRRIGLLRGVLIHVHCQVRVFSRRSAVSAVSVMRWMMVMAQPSTEAKGSGVKMIRVYIDHRGIAERILVIFC